MEFSSLQENGRVDLAVGATKVKPNHSLKMETVDPNPEEACCETACVQVKLQPAERSLLLRSRSLSHIQSLPCTPLLQAV